MEKQVHLTRLEPMRAAVFYGFGREPETEAWEKLGKWAREHNKWGDFDSYPVFGFNNPDPTPASPNYGYELWLKLEENDVVEENQAVRTFDGGLYAVLRCPVPKGEYDVIGAAWKELVAWRERSAYRHGPHQWLEKSVNPDDPALEFVLDLYLPIAK